MVRLHIVWGRSFSQEVSASFVWMIYNLFVVVIWWVAFDIAFTMASIASDFPQTWQTWDRSNDVKMIGKKR